MFLTKFWTNLTCIQLIKSSIQTFQFLVFLNSYCDINHKHVPNPHAFRILQPDIQNLSIFMCFWTHKVIKIKPQVQFQYAWRNFRFSRTRVYIIMFYLFTIPPKKLKLGCSWSFSLKIESRATLLPSPIATATPAVWCRRRAPPTAGSNVGVDTPASFSVRNRDPYGWNWALDRLPLLGFPWIATCHHRRRQYSPPPSVVGFLTLKREWLKR